MDVCMYVYDVTSYENGYLGIPNQCIIISDELRIITTLAVCLSSILMMLPC